MSRVRRVAFLSDELFVSPLRAFADMVRGDRCVLVVVLPRTGAVERRADDVAIEWHPDDEDLH